MSAKLTAAQRRLIERLGGKTFFVRGSDVRVARRLAALGLVTLTDDGAFFSGLTNADGERYSAVLTDAGRAALKALSASKLTP